MKTQKAIIERRTVHLFTEEKVMEEVIIRGIEAANHAPCHRKSFPRRFIM